MIKGIVSLLEKICSRCRPLVELYSRPYIRVVQNEIDLAQITATDRVLNVGCGAIPFTAMLVARLTGAHVVAVDRDLQAARLAQACVRKTGLAPLIQVVHCDGAQGAWTSDAFDVAIVALQAEPKAQILSCLYASSQEPKRVVVRVPSVPFRSQYDSLPHGCSIADTVPQDMKTFDRSALIMA